jgi:hypothetical protein
VPSTICVYVSRLINWVPAKYWILISLAILLANYSFKLNLTVDLGRSFASRVVSWEGRRPDSCAFLLINSV